MANYNFQVAWSSSESKFRVELDEGSGYEIKADNLEAYIYEFTITVLSITVKVTPYVDGILDPGKAKVSSFDIPPAPINLQSSDDDIEVTLTWDAVPNADYYEVWMTYGGSTVWTETVDTNSIVMKIATISEWIDDADISVVLYVRTLIGILVGPASDPSPWQYDYFTGIFCKSFDDANVSGVPLIIRLQNSSLVIEDYCYIKVYPSISSSDNGTIDDIGEDLRGIDDAILLDVSKIAKIQSGNSSYYFKIYPTISSENEDSPGITINTIFLDDQLLSGTPRVARVQLNSVYYYFKIYPTRT